MAAQPPSAKNRSSASGVFHAEVLPELSPAKTFGHLLKLYARRAKAAVLEEKLQPPTTVKNQEARKASTASDGSESVNGDCQYLVRTVPVQTSRLEELGHRLAAAAKGIDSRGEAIDEKCRPADALLLLSGSHPARRLPFLGRLYPDVYDELRLAADMRERGLLPTGLALWAVANPVIDANEAGVERVRKKVDLGADVIITQPPLAWEPFERWLRDVSGSGAIGGTARLDDAWVSSKTPAASRGGDNAGGKRAKLLVGMPVITSSEGLRFWLELCGVSHRRDICQAAYAAFRDPLAIDPASSSEPSNGGRAVVMERGAEKDAVPLASPYGQAWFETTLSKLRQLEEMGVAGVHVMAPGEAPRQRARELVDAGVFGPRSV